MPNHEDAEMYRRKLNRTAKAVYESPYRVETKFAPKVDFLSGRIEIDSRETLMGRFIAHNREVVETKNKMVREALIKMGWRPPVEIGDATTHGDKRIVQVGWFWRSEFGTLEFTAGMSRQKREELKAFPALAWENHVVKE